MAEALRAPEDRRAAALAALRGQLRNERAEPMKDWVTMKELRERLSHNGTLLTRSTVYRAKIRPVAFIGGCNRYSLEQVEAFLREQAQARLAAQAARRAGQQGRAGRA